MSLLTKRDIAVETLITASTAIGHFYRITRLLKSPETHASFLLRPFAKGINEKASILSGGILQQVALLLHSGFLLFCQLALWDLLQPDIIRVGLLCP